VPAPPTYSIPKALVNGPGCFLTRLSLFYSSYVVLLGHATQADNFFFGGVFAAEKSRVERG
jgi:hypothetical protein